MYYYMLQVQVSICNLQSDFPPKYLLETEWSWFQNGSVDWSILFDLWLKFADLVKALLGFSGIISLQIKLNILKKDALLWIIGLVLECINERGPAEKVVVNNENC